MPNTSVQTNAPGMIFPTQKGYTLGAGNPRDSAMLQMKNTNASQAAMASAVGGKKRRTNGGAIAVPQFQMQYTAQGGPGTDPNSQVAGISKISTQGTANAVYDKHALKGGSRKNKSRKGGNPNWHWGCSSGGKSRKTRKSKKTIKTRKHKRH